MIDELTVYLNLAGLKIKLEKRPKIILPELAFIGGAICKEEIGNLAPVLFVLSDLVNATEVPDEIRRIGYVNFDLDLNLDLDLDDQVNTSDSFYEQVFAIIQKLLPDLYVAKWDRVNTLALYLENNFSICKLQILKVER